MQARGAGVTAPLAAEAVNPLKLWAAPSPPQDEPRRTGHAGADTQHA